jgi:hypothetical protein
LRRSSGPFGGSESQFSLRLLSSKTKQKCLPQSQYKSCKATKIVICNFSYWWKTYLSIMWIPNIKENTSQAAWAGSP